jgi:hypothetical protein
MALVRDIDHGYKALFSRLRRAKTRIGAASSQSPTHRISIGIHGDEAAIRYNGEAGDVSLVEVAAAHEYGIGVPERSFIRAWFDDNRQRLARELKFAERPSSSAATPTPMKQLAQRWASEVKARITSRSGRLKPLAPATIAARERAGIGRRRRSTPPGSSSGASAPWSTGNTSRWTGRPSTRRWRSGDALRHPGQRHRLVRSARRGHMGERPHDGDAHQPRALLRLG